MCNSVLRNFALYNESPRESKLTAKGSVVPETSVRRFSDSDIINGEKVCSVDIHAAASMILLPSAVSFPLIPFSFPKRKQTLTGFMYFFLTFNIYE